MAFYGNKLRQVLDRLPSTLNQTKIGHRLFTKFVVTCNPTLINEIHTSKEYTRSAISRRMVEHNGAVDSLVSQDEDRARVKRPELLKFLNNDVYSRVLKVSTQRLQEHLNQAVDGERIDLYFAIRNSLQHGFMEELLGVEYSDELREKLKTVGFTIATYEETFEKLGILNYIRLPWWIKNIFSPVLKEKNKRFQKSVEIIYREAKVKSNGWMARLLELEAQGTLSHQEVLGEIRGMYIGSDTLSVSLVWAVYRLCTENPTHITKLLSSDNYARLVYMEALRLHPPFPTVSYEKENRCPFHRNDIYIVSIHNTHRNPLYWEDPELFMPTRFQQGMSKIARGSYIPFGGNERACPGTAMSMRIGPELLRTFYKNYRVAEFHAPIIRHVGVQLAENNTFYAKITRA